MTSVSRLEGLKSWQKIWRMGISPVLSINSLKALQKALEENDPRLIQGATTSPPPLLCVQDWPVDAGCVLAFCGWKGEGLMLVREVQEFFASMCFLIDQRIGELASCRYFLNWFDEAPREEMIEELLKEVNLALTQKGEQDALR